MASFFDCPACACLVHTRDASCPFCGAALRSASAPLWSVLGFALGLGAASISCGDKDGDSVGDTVTDTASTINNSQSGTSVDDSSVGSGVTYGGPDPTISTTDSDGESSATSSTTDTSAGTDTTTTTGTGTDTTTGTGTDTDTDTDTDTGTGTDTDTDTGTTG